MTEKISQLLNDRKLGELRRVLEEINAVDLSLIFDEFEPEQRTLMFRLLPKEMAAEIFVELDGDMQEALIKGFSDTELKAVVDELYLDDAVDIIEEMPANMVKRILKQSDPGTRRAINELLKYPSDSAGSIMTPEFIDLKTDMTVKDAFRHIRKTGLDKETIYTCYVIDGNRKLLGVVTARELLLSPSDRIIGEMMETNIIFARTSDDREDVARLFHKYDYSAIPVVDGEERLVGIVTFDDAIDVIEEENTEDIEKMAGMLSDDKPYLKSGIFETVKKRIPWLFILMMSATFTGAIISGFESKLQAIVVLTAFIPMLMGTGGNSGSQSSVTVIRGLSLGEIKPRDFATILWRETRIGIICGVVLGVLNFGKMLLIDHALLDTFQGFSQEGVLTVCLTVSLTVAATVVVAKIVGATLPLLAEVMHLDPAVMASPFITTIVDAISLLIYFGIASVLLGGMM